MKELTQKQLGDALVSLAAKFDEELFAKKETELDAAYWHFKWDASKSLEANLYNFTRMLDLYRLFCRRWEEHHGGHCCVVERVRDKYLMPKIKAFAQVVRDSSNHSLHRMAHGQEKESGI